MHVAVQLSPSHLQVASAHLSHRSAHTHMPSPTFRLPHDRIRPTGICPTPPPSTTCLLDLVTHPSISRALVAAPTPPRSPSAAPRSTIPLCPPPPLAASCASACVMRRSQLPLRAPDLARCAECEAAINVLRPRDSPPSTYWDGGGASFDDGCARSRRSPLPPSLAAHVRTRTQGRRGRAGGAQRSTGAGGGARLRWAWCA